jgi:hypothetical protein
LFGVGSFFNRGRAPRGLRKDEKTGSTGRTDGSAQMRNCSGEKTRVVEVVEVIDALHCDTHGGWSVVLKVLCREYQDYALDPQQQ